MARQRIPLSIILCLISPAVWADTAEEAVGKRPYEMVWAERNEDDHPALVDFENLDGWMVECTDAEATFTRSREEQLWGQVTVHGSQSHSEWIPREAA